MVVIDNRSNLESAAYDAFKNQCPADQWGTGCLDDWKRPYNEWLKKYGGEFLGYGASGWQLRFEKDEDASAFILIYG